MFLTKDSFPECIKNCQSQRLKKKKKVKVGNDIGDSPKRATIDRQAHEKMSNIIRQQENANLE